MPNLLHLVQHLHMFWIPKMLKSLFGTLFDLFSVTFDQSFATLSIQCILDHPIAKPCTTYWLSTHQSSYGDERVDLYHPYLVIEGIDVSL